MKIYGTRKRVGSRQEGSTGPDISNLVGKVARVGTWLQCGGPFPKVLFPLICDFSIFKNAHSS